MKSYSFKDIAVLVSAPPAIPEHQVTGFADGDDVIMIERNTENAKYKVGAGGQMAVAITADRTGKITLKLQQTSPSNKIFNAIHSLQQAGPRKMAPVQIFLQDLSRQDTAVALAGVIEKLPSISRGEGINNQEWVFVCEDVEIFLGDPKFNGLATAVAEAIP
jgi:hypothetical protein